MGWVFGKTENVENVDVRDADQLYTLLEQEVITEFYERDSTGIPIRWLKRVVASMTQLTLRFSNSRMAKEYVEQAYLPAARAVERRAADNAPVARDLYDWSLQLEENWQDVRFGEMETTECEGAWRFEVTAYLGELQPDVVQVELYEDPVDGKQSVIIPLGLDHRLPGSVNGYVFIGSAPMERPHEHYTPRIVARHRDAFIPAEDPRVLWYK